MEAWLFTDCSNQKWLLQTQLIGQFTHVTGRQMLRSYCGDFKDQNIPNLHWGPPEYTWLPWVISKADNYSSGTNWHIKVKSENYRQESPKARSEREERWPLIDRIALRSNQQAYAVELRTFQKASNCFTSPTIQHWLSVFSPSHLQGADNAAVTPQDTWCELCKDSRLSSNVQRADGYKEILTLQVTLHQIKYRLTKNKETETNITKLI